MLAVIMTAYNSYYVYPSFTKLLVENTEDEALRLGSHLAGMFFHNNQAPSKAKAAHVFNDMGVHFDHFGLMKLKVFSPSGEILHSTSGKEIGKINEHDYFHNIVAAGYPYTKVVKKDTKSLEGQLVTVDVVETYVPVMSVGKFIGAFELYYDITERNSKLNKVMNKSLLVPLLMLFFGVVITTIMMKKLDQSIMKQREVEEELKIFTGKLHQSNLELESFAHIASHDLQEPLRKVQAFGDRLKMKFGDTLGEQGLDYLERMQNASRRMQTLINGLLMYSRVASKAKPFEKVDLDKLTKEVVSDLEVRIQETGGHVEINGLPTVNADPLQMRQLFQNLIGNALKFHKEGTAPAVKLSAVPDNGIKAERGAHVESAHYQIICEDNGIGFENQYKDRVFGVFQRLHGRKEYEGSGIGLSVCKKIVERHGGKIEAESSPGEGTKFIIDLPGKQGGGGTL
jgi:signal transduction histidine kinase